MTPLSQQNAPQIVGLSAASSEPATPLTTHLTHASAMPVFFAMNPTSLPTISPIFFYPGPFFPFFYPSPLTAVLPVPPTTPALSVASSSSTAVLPSHPTATDLPVASSSPASGVPSSSPLTALSIELKQLSQPLTSLLRGKRGVHSKVFTQQEDDLLLQIYIEAKPKTWLKKAVKKFDYKNLTNKQIENRLYTLKSRTGPSKSDEAHLDVTTKSIINHARHALQSKKANKRWSDSDEAQFSEIYKNRASYENQGTDWRSVAKETLNRTDNAIYHHLRKMRLNNPSL